MQLSTVMACLSVGAQAVFLLVVAYFALYVLLELRVLFISRRVERRRLSELSPAPAAGAENFSPPVTVLLRRLPFSCRSATKQRSCSA